MKVMLTQIKNEQKHCAYLFYPAVYFPSGTEIIQHLRNTLETGFFRCDAPFIAPQLQIQTVNFTLNIRK